MSMPGRRILALGALLLGAAGPAAGSGGGQGGSLVLDGAVAHGGVVNPEMLAGLPVTSLPVTQATGHGVGSQRAGGVLLWDLLQQAQPQDVVAKHASLRHTVSVVGRDGYAVAFSFGELDPAGTADPVLVVMRDGRLDLVVPADHTGARNVHDLNRITVH